MFPRKSRPDLPLIAACATEFFGRFLFTSSHLRAIAPGTFGGTSNRSTSLSGVVAVKPRRVRHVGQFTVPIGDRGTTGTRGSRLFRVLPVSASARGRSHIPVGTNARQSGAQERQLRSADQESLRLYPSHSGTV